MKPMQTPSTEDHKHQTGCGSPDAACSALLGLKVAIQLGDNDYPTDSQMDRLLKLKDACEVHLPNICNNALVIFRKNHPRDVSDAWIAKVTAQCDRIMGRKPNAKDQTVAASDSRKDKK